MAYFKKYQNKKIAIYGMGITGFSAAITFKKMGAKVFCWDDNRNERNKIKKTNFNLTKFWLNKNYFDKILISPGIDINKCRIKSFLNKNIKKIITDLDLFFELNKDSVIISITGTNGKSTTCKLIEKILKTAKYKVKTVGNIGKPILFSSNLKKKYIFIIEASSYQLQYSKEFRSNYAAILNISPDHLERHKNMQNYVNAKSKIFFAQKNSDYLYVSKKNKYLKLIKKIFSLRKIKSKLVLINESSYRALLKKIKNKYFKDKGNIENLFFAYKIAKAFKIKDKIIIRATNAFKGLPHRQEIFYSDRDLICVNDSKATSFDASAQALSKFNKIYWIVGGLPKYKDYFNLKNFKNKIIKAYIIGKRTSFFEKLIKNNISYTVSANLKNAVNSIYKDINYNNISGSTILLSPAAASFDQFRNFEDRGVYFKKLIKQKFKKN